MPKRQIKKTQILYEDNKEKEQKRSRSRSREKTKVQQVDNSSRRARLAAMKCRQREEEEDQLKQMPKNVKIEIVQPQKNIEISIEKPQKDKMNEPVKEVKNQVKEVYEEEDEEEDEKRILLKPVFISKEDRNNEENMQTLAKESERKKKALKYNTKLLLKENREIAERSDEEDINLSSDEQNRTDIPDDDDQKNQKYEYELWRVRQLKRIKRDREERRKIEIEKAQIQRRRKMNNQEILLENKVLGSDANDNSVETKYVYMQKYYHKGAFYQDSNDPVFKRDYNLPTPLQMQDKSSLPEIMQRRMGKFGTKGQSKYKHLTAQDTSNFDPQFRPDESIMANWKKKMAGYKGASHSNI